MKREEILSKVDHTLLKVGATFQDVKEIIDDGIKYGAYSVCISPCFVKEAKEYAKGKIKICTVIGFPSGNHSTKAKVEEAKIAIDDGADEIDMVINVGLLKAKKYEEVLREIQFINIFCHNLAPIGKEVVLKVIIETCLLEKEEIVKMCEIVKESGADFIKTSTGFSTGGATFEDIKLMKETIDNLGGGLKIKAAGGIKDFNDAEKFIELGADRLGTSRLVNSLKNNS